LKIVQTKKRSSKLGKGIVDPKAFRFENSSNEKTLKQAWRFFLLNYLFVTTEGFKPIPASRIFVEFL